MIRHFSDQPHRPPPGTPGPDVAPEVAPGAHRRRYTPAQVAVRLALAGLLALVLLWAPLPFGSVTRGFELLLALAACAALALAAGAGRLGEPLRAAAPVAAALGALAVLGLLQSLPWPPGLVSLVSPRHLELTRQAEALIPEPEEPAETAPAETESPSWPHLSLAPGASRQTALELLVLAALFTAAAVAGRRSRDRRLMAAACVAAGLFEVLYGGRRWLGGTLTIWGVEVPGSAVRLRGTFVNPDHLALYLELVLAVVVAWGWWAARHGRRRPRLEDRLLLLAPPLLIWAALMAALAFTGSRAGLVAAVVALGVQGLLALSLRRPSAVPQRSTWRSRALTRMRAVVTTGAVAALALGLLAWLGIRQGLGRLLATSPYEIAWGIRTLAYRDCLELWQLFPWLGTGLGTFRQGFPLVQEPEVYAEWMHAHSGPLELAATTGLVGLAVAIFGVVVLLRTLLASLRQGWRSEEKAAALAALGALTAALVHECADFGLTLPANAFTLAILCGAAVAVPRPEPQDASGGTTPS